MTERLAVRVGLTLSNAPYKRLTSSDESIVLDELRELSQPSNQERREALFSSGQEEAHLAFKVLKKLIGSNNQTIRNSSFQVLELYLQDANLVTPLTQGSNIDAASRKKHTLRNILAYIKAPNESAQAEALKQITLATGYFYTERGDDNLKSNDRHDDRLFNYFNQLAAGKNSLATKLVSDLLTQSSFLQQSKALRDNPPEWATNDSRVSLSLAQVDRANSRIARDGSARIGFITYANAVSCDPSHPAEQEFLKSLALPGIDPKNFKLDFNEIVDALNCTNDVARDGSIKYSIENVVEHLTAAYFLLDFRKKDLEATPASGAIANATKNRNIKLIDKQIARLQVAVNNIGSLDNSGSIHRKLEANISSRLPTCFLYSIQGSTAVAEATLAPAADLIINKARTEYGAALPAVTTTGVKGLRDTNKAVQEESRKLSSLLANQLSNAISPDQVFFDYSNIPAFKSAIEDWKANMADLTNPSSPGAREEFARRFAMSGDGLAAPLPVIDMEKATESLKTHLRNHPDSSVQYVLQNWDKLYNVSFDKFTMEPHNSEYTDKNLPHTAEALTAHILDSLTKNEREAQGSTIEVHLRSDAYDESLNQLLFAGNDEKYEVVKLIRDQINEMRGRDEAIYTALDRSGSALTDLLKAQDETLVKTTGSPADINSRLCGVMILSNKIANSSASDFNKQTALRRIARDLLNLDDAGTAQFIQALNISRPILDTACNYSIASIIQDNKTALVPDAATLLQYRVMTVDIHEHGVQKLDDKINQDNQKTIQGYAKLMFGSDLEFLQQHIKVLAERCTPETMEALKEAHAQMQSSTDGEEKLKAQGEFFKLLSGTFGNDFIRRFTNNDILDDQLFSRFMDNSIFDNDKGSGILKMFMDLWKFVIEELLTTTTQKSRLAAPPERNYNRLVDNRRLST